MSKSVYLSPSIQEGNIGYGDYGTEEKRMNEVCDVTQKHLFRHGLTVFRNRPDMTLKQVVADSNAKDPTIHFAIHSNAFNGKVRGSEIYCHRFGGEGERLARLVYDELESITPTKGRGIKEGKDHFGPGKPLYELSATVAPAALIEVAFHDQPDDAKWILENIEPIGIAIAKGILKYFDIEWIDDRSELEKAVDILAETGFILSPQYWKDNAVPGGAINGAYAGLLVKRIGSFIKTMLEGLNKLSK